MAAPVDGTPVPEMELHVAMFPWFAFGHIYPFVELANKIASHGVRVSIFSAPGNIPRIASALKSGPGYKTAVVPVHIPPVEGLPSGVDSTTEMTPAMAELLKLALDMMGPQIEAHFAELRPDIVVFDFAMPWLPPIARKNGVKSIFFSIATALTIAYLVVPSRLNIDGRQPSVEDLRRPPPGLEVENIPTFKHYECREFHYAYERFGGPCAFERCSACFEGCDAVLLKSCSEMEGPYIKYIETQYKKPVLLAGPLIPDRQSGELDESWAGWLSRFPEKSVILCSFGSEAFLGNDQIRELAWGLEMTGAPFILALKFPKNEESRLEEALPEGFLEKVKDRGMVHTGWIPQQLLLAHPNVGYFINHAGSSSIFEGPVNDDLRMIFLPLRLDQHLTSKLVVYNLKTGVEVDRDDGDGFFTKDGICKAVKASAANNERGGEWRDFLRNREKHEGFSRDLVKKLKEMKY